MFKALIPSYYAKFNMMKSRTQISFRLIQNQNRDGKPLTCPLGRGAAPMPDPQTQPHLKQK